MSFAEQYVNAYRDAMVETGQWQDLSKKEQTKAIKDAVARAQEVNGKMSAIIQMNKMQANYVDQAKVRAAFVANVLRHYRYEYEEDIRFLRAKFAKELGIDS
jgi:hypothetical protein